MGRLVQIADRSTRAGAIDDQAKDNVRAFSQGVERDFASGLRSDEHLRQAVVEDEGKLARRQERIDVGVVEPGPLAGSVALDEPRVVFHEQRIVVARFQADCAQEMGEPIAARLELPIRDGFA
jgi:hypothetical protein